MNVLSGLMVEGMTLNTEDNFQSVPGLMLWPDARERVTLDDGGKVVFWGDKSTQATNFIQNFENRQPGYEKNLWILSQPAILGGNYMQSNRKDYRFLHNGSACAVYSIIKVDLLGNNQAIIVNTSAGGTGISIFVSKGSNGSISIRVKNGNTDVRNNYITNVANTVGSNPIMIFRYVFKGRTVPNNMLVSLGNFNTTFTNNATGYSAGDNSYFRIAGSDEIGKPLRTGLTLLYNWNGLPSATIDAYDANVMALLNKERLIFEQLDAL